MTRNACSTRERTRALVVLRAFSASLRGRFRLPSRLVMSCAFGAAARMASPWPR